MSRDPATLADMIQACKLISDFCKGLSFAMFSMNVEKQSAVLHQFMIFGEATKRLSNEFRDEHPEAPWTEIAGMRDRLIHGYDEVDLSLVWDVTQKRIPSLLNFLTPLLPNPKA